MASDYENDRQADMDDSAVAAGHDATSAEDLRERYPQLRGFADMDDGQKIEAFRNVLGSLHDELNQQQI
ncbi:hypothetical protein OZX73_04045 [Bifidobacterium sp. ESL0775]|uniref:hypothetical protein n=1 Tax=Bifidobacterium sp. ESL0775 TaxID=2983230 RepID=UPI0023F66329|nr:hypothetical protein [Bifidobacterium sp. ESL0775]WEV68485.1 hypothetical protein OZX73_04045 [Bifidobacterium sp. ESL0775]